MLKASRTLCLVAVFCWFAGATPASAFDLVHFARLLSPVFTAQQVGTVCNSLDGDFLTGTSGPMGTINAYAAHMRTEVLAGLPANAAEVVVRAAAEAARLQAQTQLRQLQDGQGPLGEWCRTTAKPFILKVLAFHDHEHRVFDEMISQARESESRDR